MDLTNKEELHQDSIYFSRELEVVLPRIYERRGAPMSAERLFPIIPGGNRDMDRYIARAYDYSGSAHRGRIDGDGCKSDIPLISSSMKEEAYKIRYFKMGAQFTDRELRLSRMLGKGIQERELAAAVRELMWFENEMIFKGDSLTGAKGLFDSTLMTQATLPTGNWTDATTAEQLYADMEAMILHIENQTNCTYTDQVTIVLPCKAWNLLNGTQYSPGTDTTVLQYVLRNWGSMVASIEKAREFDAERKALVYIRDDRYMGHLRVPMRQVGPYRDPKCELTTVHYEMGTSGLIVFDRNAQCMFSDVIAP